MTVLGKEDVGRPEGVETLIEVLGELGDAVVELRDVLSPVGVVMDGLRSLRDPVCDSVCEVVDSVIEPGDSVTEL